MILSTKHGVTNLDMTYDLKGNITNRTDVASNATWTYHATKKHAVTQAGSASFTYTYDANGNAITRNGFNIGWNKSNYPTSIAGSGETTSLYYDGNNQRWKQVYVKGSTTETTLYAGGLLEKVITGSTTDWRHYISAGEQTVAIYSRQSTGTNTLRYTLEDHQGSLSKITTSTGTTYVSENFSAYGNRRNPATWSGAPTSGDLTNINAVSREGYTGQDALGAMGLNHMNGRVQDAITGRFLSADPYITEPGNTQNYNRYSYVYNNPLSFTDPSGFFVIPICFNWDITTWLADQNLSPGSALPEVTNTHFTFCTDLSLPDPQATPPDISTGGTSGGTTDPGSTNPGTANPANPPLAEVVVAAKKSQTQKPNKCYAINGLINTVSSAVSGTVTGATGAALTGNLEAVPAAAFGGLIVGTMAGMFDNRYMTASAATGVGIGSYAMGRASGASAIATTVSRVATGFAP